MNQETLRRTRIFTNLAEIEREERDASDTTLAIPVDDYDICRLAEEGCESAKDPNIFRSFCDGKYSNCLERKDRIGRVN